MTTPQRYSYAGTGLLITGGAGMVIVIIIAALAEIPETARASSMSLTAIAFLFGGIFKLRAAIPLVVYVHPKVKQLEDRVGALEAKLRQAPSGVDTAVLSEEKYLADLAESYRLGREVGRGEGTAVT